MRLSEAGRAIIIGGFSVATSLPSFEPDMYQIERPRFSNLDIWLKALAFHKRNWSDVVAVFPLLFVPIFTDTFHAILVRQEVSPQGRISISAAIKETFGHILDVFLMKFYFEFVAALWSYLPVYGWFKDFQHRVNWAMVSNVVAFERLTGSIGDHRCVEVASSVPLARAARILFTIPSLLVFLYLAIIGLGTYLFETSLFFWVFGFMIFWTLLPWAAVVNTYLYLSIPGVQDRILYKSPSSRVRQDSRQFCPRCGHYEHIRGTCRRLSISVRAYPAQFPKRCNAVFFLQSNLLPANVVCPSCSAELELEEGERSSFVFSCPECSTRTDWSAGGVRGK
jgi:hypothetical protein